MTDLEPSGTLAHLIENARQELNACEQKAEELRSLIRSLEGSMELWNVAAKFETGDLSLAGVMEQWGGKSGALKKTLELRSSSSVNGAASVTSDRHREAKSGKSGSQPTKDGAPDSRWMEPVSVVSKPSEDATLSDLILYVLDLDEQRDQGNSMRIGLLSSEVETEIKKLTGRKLKPREVSRLLWKLCDRGAKEQLAGQPGNGMRSAKTGKGQEKRYWLERIERKAVQ